MIEFAINNAIDAVLHNARQYVEVVVNDNHIHEHRPQKRIEAVLYVGGDGPKMPVINDERKIKDCIDNIIKDCTDRIDDIRTEITNLMNSLDNGKWLGPNDVKALKVNLDKIARKIG